MSRPVSNVKTDPELVKQLNKAATSEQPVEAVLRLRPDDLSQVAPSPERTEALVKQLLTRVKNQVGRGASRYNVFKNLGSFVVSAHPTFIRELMAQPEIAGVMANQQPDSAAIPPINKSPLPTSQQSKAYSDKKQRTRSSTSSRIAAARKRSK